MSVPYASTGRVHQKARTRDALISSTRELLAQGVLPTMVRVANAAAVSRTTAYRYFPRLQELLVAAYPHVEQLSLLGSHPPNDPVARLEIVAERHSRRILENEGEMRTVLRLSLQGVRPPDLPMHRGLRIAWIEDALAPLRGELPAEDFRRLVHGIGATLGIESFAWLTDIAGVAREQAAAIIQSNALTLLRSAIADGAIPRASAREVNS
jgi:AcrR family transcriptional regulator